MSRGKVLLPARRKQGRLEGKEASQRLTTMPSSPIRCIQYVSIASSGQKKQRCTSLLLAALHPFRYTALWPRSAEIQALPLLPKATAAWAPAVAAHCGGELKAASQAVASRAVEGTPAAAPGPTRADGTDLFTWWLLPGG